MPRPDTDRRLFAIAMEVPERMLARRSPAQYLEVAVDAMHIVNKWRRADYRVDAEDWLALFDAAVENTLLDLHRATRCTDCPTPPPLREAV